MPSGKTDRKEGESSGEESKVNKRSHGGSPAEESNEAEGADNQDGSRRSRRKKQKVGIIRIFRQSSKYRIIV